MSRRQGYQTNQLSTRRTLRALSRLGLVLIRHNSHACYRYGASTVTVPSNHTVVCENMVRNALRHAGIEWADFRKEY